MTISVAIRAAPSIMPRDIHTADKGGLLSPSDINQYDEYISTVAPNTCAIFETIASPGAHFFKSVSPHKMSLREC